MTTKEQIIALLKEGKSYSKIAQELKVSSAYVGKVKEKMTYEEKIKELESTIKNLSK